HHHGRERTLGAPPSSAARGRTSRRRRIRAFHGRDRCAGWNLGAHAVCVLGRKLEEASQERSGFSHGTALPLSEAGSPDAEQESYSPGVHWTAAGTSIDGARQNGVGATGH